MLELPNILIVVLCFIPVVVIDSYFESRNDSKTPKLSNRITISRDLPGVIRRHFTLERIEDIVTDKMLTLCCKT